jgi:hypothetical protein
MLSHDVDRYFLETFKAGASGHVFKGWRLADVVQLAGLSDVLGGPEIARVLNAVFCGSQPTSSRCATEHRGRWRVPWAWEDRA